MSGHSSPVVLDVAMSRKTTRLLYLARHAEPEGNDAGLTPDGARQAEYLGRRLAPLAVDRITHGPLSRAAETTWPTYRPTSGGQDFLNVCACEAPCSIA